MATINKAMCSILILFIKTYQLLISPLLGSRCRFYPSCSQYAIEALEHHGVVKGFFMSVKRLFRCHPGCAGGFDPVKKK